MLFQVLCGFEPIFYTTHPNEESKNAVDKPGMSRFMTGKKFLFFSVLYKHQKSFFRLPALIALG